MVHFGISIFHVHELSVKVDSVVLHSEEFFCIGFCQVFGKRLAAVEIRGETSSCMCTFEERTSAESIQVGGNTRSGHELPFIGVFETEKCVICLKGTLMLHQSIGDNFIVTRSIHR